MPRTKLHPMIISADDERVIANRAAFERLRDAAPDLLAALEAFYAAYQYDPMTNQLGLTAKARAAIAKARG